MIVLNYKTFNAANSPLSRGALWRTDLHKREKCGSRSSHKKDDDAGNPTGGVPQLTVEPIEL